MSSPFFNTNDAYTGCTKIQPARLSDLAPIPDALSNWDHDDLAFQHPANWPSLWQPNVDGTVAFNGSESAQLAASQEACPTRNFTGNHKPVNDEYNARLKERNRVAQKAFRQRKQEYLETLERKLNELESRSMLLEEENRHLRAELASLLPIGKPSGHNMLSNDLLVGEAGRDITPEASTEIGVDEHHVRISKDTHGRLVKTEDTCQLIHTVWELIQGSDLFEERTVDLGHVYDQLKEIARRDRKQFTLEDGVRMILEESAPRDPDDLL